MIAGATPIPLPQAPAPKSGAGDHASIALASASPDGLEAPALCQAQALPDGLPDWVQLLPAGPTIATVDGRGPYRVADAAALAAASMADGARLPIDENHATDLAGPKGGPSPARGWIVAIEARRGPGPASGIWGRVEWTEAGKALMADRAYRFISPVIAHQKDGTVTRILRAALVNTPNLRGMAALNQQETTMDKLPIAVLTALGLKDGADEAAALAAIAEFRKAGEPAAAAVQAAIVPIARAAGLKDDASATALLAAVTTLAAGDGAAKDKVITALQSEVATLGGELKSLRDGRAREKATAAVDAAIAAGKPGVKPLRDHYIARHMADPSGVAKEFDGLPSLTSPSGASAAPPARDKDGKVALNAEQLTAAKLLGVKPEDYQKTLAAESAAAAL